MSVEFDEPQDDDVPEQALKALVAAHARAVQQGHPQVVVRDGQLVRISQTDVQVLKPIPERMPVTVRKKSIDR